MAKEESQLVDKAALLADEEFEIEVHTIPGMGEIKVRSLSRAELMRVGQLGSDKISEAEAYMVSRGCVEPKFTVDDVKKWQKLPKGVHLDALVEKLNQMSGVEDEAGKEATIRFPD